MTAEWEIVCGDALSTLREFPDATFDSIVTDPPAGIGFMGKEWDGAKGGRVSWIAWLAEVMTECLRVLKPGGHALVWAIPRTSHWTATAVEDAGFEVRDVVTHVFGTGFPKSLNVSKAIEAGGAPLGDDTKAWEGFGTALKPAAEHWILARKSVIGTVAANVLKHGTGALNIAATRIGTGHDKGEWPVTARRDPAVLRGAEIAPAPVVTDKTKGRWPANVTLDEFAAAELDAQVAPSRSTKGKPRKGQPGNGYGMTHTGAEYEDAGGPSRFFYVAKPSTSEREAGLDGLPLRTGGELTDRVDGTDGLNSPRAGAGRKGGRRNHHPTVKSLELMTWLIRLITPPGGVVLDPFCGSGSTVAAAVRAGFSAVGIDQSDEYVEIARRRVEYWITAGV